MTTEQVAEKRGGLRYRLCRNVYAMLLLTMSLALPSCVFVPIPLPLSPVVWSAGSDDDAAKRLSELGKICKDVDYEQAEQCYLRTLKDVEKEYGTDHAAVLIVLHQLAHLYNDHDRVAENLSTMQRMLAIREKLVGPDDPLLPKLLRDAGMLCMVQGHFAEAESLLQRALEIDEKRLGSEDIAVSWDLNALAMLHQYLAHYEKAEELLIRSLDIAEKAYGREHDVAVALSNLAGVCQRLKKYEKAESLFQRALAIAEKETGAESSELLVNTLNNLATLYKDQEQYEKAEPLYQRSLEIIEKQQQNPDSTIWFFLLGNLGDLYCKLGQYGKAEPFLQRITPIAVNSRQPELAALGWHGMFFMYEKSDPYLAVFYGKQAVNILQEVRTVNTQMDMASQRSFLKRYEAMVTSLADLLFAQNRLFEGQQVLDMLKEAEYHEFSGASEADDPRRTRAAYTLREATWEQRFRELAEKLRQAVPGSAEYAALKKDFDAFFEEVKAAFAPDAPGEENRLDNRSPMQKHLGELGDGTLLVQYLMPQDRLWILVTAKDGMKARQVGISADEMRQKIDAFREALNPGQDERLAEEQKVRAMGKELFDLLVAPVADDLEKAQLLMLAPDGALRYLPFAALHDGKQYLIQRYVLSNFTDMTKDRITDPPNENWTFAGFGVSKSDTDGDLPAVPGELQGIRNAMPGTVRLDKAFTRTALLDVLEDSPPVVHIASHFKFTEGDEQASYLLTGDGRLTLSEIRRAYRFNRVDLVALSACETAVGGGADKNGREVEGLGVLVQRQGAKGVLASLWPVADERTGQFMRLFYGYRQQGLTKAEALQQAQLAFIDNRVPEALSEARPAGTSRGGFTDVDGNVQPGSSRRSAAPDHPYYWAPFILMGNWL